MKTLMTIMLVLVMTAGVSAQQRTEKSEALRDPAIRLRSCRIGMPGTKVDLRRAPSPQGTGDTYIGDRHQLVVLASFKDQDFAESREAALQTWDKIFNAENYSEGMYVGSVHDYFMAQSYKKFNLTFDLVFVELPDTRNKYRSTAEHDEYSQYMVDDIMDVLQTQDIDWSLYDWDGDSFVNQLLIIYAGEGMNISLTPNTIWPHSWWLSRHANLETEDPYDCRGYRTVMYGDKEFHVDQYCCVQECVESKTIKTPFGTICHEYTHCFGFPDYYNGATPVIGKWDLMDSGNYNHLGFRPCNYSAHERMLMGWLTPIELTGTTTIADMPALIDEPVAYIIRNDGAENEYYFVENRQQKGWDENIPGSGIVVFHIDYSPNAWEDATEFCNSDDKNRYDIFPANNKSWDLEGWGYPYIATDRQGNDSLANNCLTNTSLPAARLNNPNVDGKLLMSKPITQMSVDANGLASFVFMDDEGTSVHDVTRDPDRARNGAAAIYDLQGRRLSKPAKGLYIQGNQLKMSH